MKVSSRVMVFLASFVFGVVLLTHANAQEVLQITDVTASTFQEPNRPNHVLDGDLSTRWSAESVESGGDEDQPYIEFELGSINEVSGIRIAWFRGDRRQSSFRVMVSQNGVEYVVVVLDGESSGNTQQLETYSFRSIPGKFVRLVGYGNTDNRWNSITEIKVLGQAMPLPRSLPIERVIASDAQAPHVPENTIDGDLQTRWSSQDSDAVIQYQLDAVYAISALEIAFHRGDSRITDFGLRVSRDGKNWSWVHLFGSDQGLTTQLVPYVFHAVPARYVEIHGYGNSDNSWTSITEIKIRGHEADLEQAEVRQVDASEAQGSNVPERTIDGDLGTRWSAFGDDQHITFALASTVRVNQVNVAWFRGNRRQASFTIQVWDAYVEEWANVLFPTSSGDTLQAEPHVFTGMETNAVRIVGHGNSDNEWNSITEVKIFSTPGAASD